MTLDNAYTQNVTASIDALNYSGEEKKRPIVERFLRYVAVDTQSRRGERTPSSEGQRVLADMLACELEKIGARDVRVTGHAYVFATIPACGEKINSVPVMAWVAHLDTHPSVSGRNIRPRFVPAYDGGDILLDQRSQDVLSPREFPRLLEYVGQTLITTDGTTLLGADDKAGIAAIMTAAERLLSDCSFLHGPIRVAFFPDEEVGHGAQLLDVARLDADFAYTVDDAGLGRLSYETFNAARFEIRVKGFSVHTGGAKGAMINAARIASEIAASFPSAETPEVTDGYEGFYHIRQIEGDVEEAILHGSIRDFDEKNFARRKDFVRALVARFEARYGKGVLELELQDGYLNMAQTFASKMHVVDYALAAMRRAGVTPEVVPTRGGTDGARLCAMGLPTPNLFTGGENFHSRMEFLPVDSLEKCAATLVELARVAGEDMKKYEKNDQE